MSEVQENLEIARLATFLSNAQNGEELNILMHRMPERFDYGDLFKQKEGSYTIKIKDNATGEEHNLNLPQSSFNIDWVMHYIKDANERYNATQEIHKEPSGVPQKIDRERNLEAKLDEVQQVETPEIKLPDVKKDSTNELRNNENCRGIKDYPGYFAIHAHLKSEALSCLCAVGAQGYFTYNLFQEGPTLKNLLETGIKSAALIGAATLIPQVGLSLGYFIGKRVDSIKQNKREKKFLLSSNNAESKRL